MVGMLVAHEAGGVQTVVRGVNEYMWAAFACRRTPVGAAIVVVCAPRGTLYHSLVARSTEYGTGKRHDRVEEHETESTARSRNGARAHIYMGEKSPPLPSALACQPTMGHFFFREGETGQVQPHQPEESWAGSPCS